MKTKLAAAFLAAIALMPFAPAVTADKAPGEDISPAIAVIRKRTALRKSAGVSQIAHFETGDFKDILGQGATHVCITEAPVNGNLFFDGMELAPYSPVSVEDANKLVYHAPDSECVAVFRFKDHNKSDREAISCRVSVKNGLTAPKSRDITARTYRDAATFVDPSVIEEGCKFEIIQAPTSGVASVDKSGRIIYRPKTGFEGRDKLKFRLLNGDGLCSAVSTIDMEVTKPYKDVFFADLTDDPLQKAAIDLASCTSMEFEKDGEGRLIFDPDRTLTSSEAMKILETSGKSEGPLSETSLILIPDEELTRAELALTVSAYTNASRSENKNLFEKFLDLFMS